MKIINSNVDTITYNSVVIIDNNNNSVDTITTNGVAIISTNYSLFYNKILFISGSHTQVLQVVGPTVPVGLPLRSSGRY